MSLNYAKKIIENSSHMVSLLGITMSMDCGCLNYRQEEGLYDLEEKYGRAPEEIFSATYYNTRQKQFFDFYKNEILAYPGVPNKGFETLAKMEKDGVLKAIVTRELYSLPKRAGCQNVIELHGSIYRNKCPRCGKNYSIDYMKEAPGIPLCPDCKVPIRPQVCFVGELIDSTLIANASTEIEQADTLLILGSHLQSILVQTCIPYFKGDKIILINEKEHHMDDKADCVIHAKPSEVLPLLYDN